MLHTIKRVHGFLLALAMAFLISAIPATPTLAVDDSITIVQVQLQLTNDVNGDGIAGIGDQITVTVTINNNDGGCGAQNTQVFVDLTKYGGPPNQALNCNIDNNGAGDVFVFQFVIQNAGNNGVDAPGNDPLTAVQVVAVDADENNALGDQDPTETSNPLGDGLVDNVGLNGADAQAPVVTEPNIGTGFVVDAGVQGVGGVQDQFRITYSPPGDNVFDPDPNEVRANLAALGGDVTQQLFDDGSNGDATAGDGVFTFVLPIVEGAGGGIDANNLQVSVVMQDDAGNNSGAPVNDSNTFSIDNVSPTVTAGNTQTVFIVDNPPNTVADPGDVLRTTHDNSGGGDNNADGISSFFVDLSLFGGPSLQTLFDDGSNGDQNPGDNISTFDYTVSAGSFNNLNNRNATVILIDNAGNQSVAIDDSNITVNNAVAAGGRVRDRGDTGAIAQQSFSAADLEDAGDDLFRDGGVPVFDSDADPGVVQDPSCECSLDENKTYDWVDDLFIDTTAQYDDGVDLICINPDCLDQTFVGFNLEDTPAEAEFRKRYRAKLAAGKRLSDAHDKAAELKREYEEAEIAAQTARADHSLGTGTKEDYDTKNAKAESAYRRMNRHISGELNNAKNDYNQASYDYDQVAQDGIDLLGRERRNEIIREELAGPSKGGVDFDTSPLFQCFDPICAVNILDLVEDAQFTHVLPDYSKCSNSCTKSDSYKAPDVKSELEKYYQFDDGPSLRTPRNDSSGDLGERFYYDDADRGVIEEPEGEDSTTRIFDSVERIFDERDLGPFRSLSEPGVFSPGSSFATDIDGHPSEIFIIDLYEYDAVSGINNGNTYGPDQTSNRASLLKVGFNVYDIPVPQTVTTNPFKDVFVTDWHARYFDAAAGIYIHGVGGENQSPEDSLAMPDKVVNLIDALSIYTRMANVDVRTAEDYDTAVVPPSKDMWWYPTWQWAEKFAVVSPDTIEVEVTDPETKEKKTEQVKGDDPKDDVTRAKMAEVAVKVRSTRHYMPCNCDKEKAEYEKAKQEAADAKTKAEADQAAADKAEEEAKDAEKEQKDADKKVKDLEAFFDDSSFIETEQGKYTTGDMKLLRLANQKIYGLWAAGTITAEEAMEQWEETGIEDLEELRAEKQKELDEAREEQKKARDKAEQARNKADAAAAKAKKSKEDADKAAEKEAELKKAYDDCLVKCKIVNDKWAAEQRRLEAERRRKAEADARRRRAQAAAAAAAASSGQSGSGSSGQSTSGGGSGEIPGAAKDPCKEKFLQAIAARGQQIAKTRPDDVPDAPPELKPGMDFASAVGEMIAGAAQAASKGSSTAASIASGLASLPNIAYGLWVDYVGGKIKEAGTRIINNRRICNVIKYSTKGVCGYETFPPGQVVYWQKDSSGKYKVVVMGPGDKVSEGQCQ